MGEDDVRSDGTFFGYDDDQETLDEIVAKDVRSVHLEALDDCRWYIHLELSNGELWQVDLGSVTGRAKGFARTELLRDGEVQ